MPDGQKPELHYRVKFDLTKMTREQKDALSEAESALSRAGISFDMGGDGNVRDWEWDWSLNGPMTIEARQRSSAPPAQQVPPTA